MKNEKCNQCGWLIFTHDFPMCWYVSKKDNKRISLCINCFDKQSKVHVDTDNENKGFDD